MSIVRHTKVKDTASPYDGDWIYGSSRVSKHPGVKKEVGKLLRRQKDNCTRCGLNFRLRELIHFNRIVPKSEGGGDTYKKKQVLHRHCHDSKTAEELKAVKH